MGEAFGSVGLTGKPEQVAIIGMAGRFPDARNVDEFWRNLKDGIESIRPFTPEELQASGIDEETLSDPRFVNAGAFLPDADSFDAPFFGISTRDAEIMDPQHRVFLETAWEALENAGYDPENFRGKIGIFGGVAPNTYYQNNLVTQTDLLRTLGRYSVMLGSEKEYAITRVAFKLNLTGPSLSVNTACSTSGVAIHLACQSLLCGECDMALAGGGRINVPLAGGYLYEEGGIQSPDGHCRAFDAKARGTVIGSGVGMVVLRRLSEAIRNGDLVYTVIKGTAINNDGSQKIGFTAPSVQGQSSVIKEALFIADVSPDSIGYLEAHGTGTSIGDPIEIAALTKAYRYWTERKNYCPIGSVKTNIGHLDAGAGVTGVIKATLALRDKLIPPSLNFEKPNPQIDFVNSPFYVNTELREWATDGTPRRAGVSSFGLGGTNAHIILEEAPKTEPSGPSRSQQLLLLSAKSENALEQSTKNLVEHLRQNPDTNFADIAYTLQTGRRAFDHRRIVVCQNVDDAIAAQDPIDRQRVVTSKLGAHHREIVFMFSGQGSQYVNMGLELYQSEPVFKQQIDRCSEILQPYLSFDLRQLLYPNGQNQDEMAQKLQETIFTQPALFTIEYALAMQWMDWGIQPHALIGHSIGEYVAACMAGVFSLEEALSLVSTRGKLIQELPSGLMLAIPLSESQIEPYLNGKVSVAVIDGPSLCVVSGEHEAIKDLEKQLSAQEVESHLLHTSHAFHSKMMDPALGPFEVEVRKVKFSVPQIPFVSNVTGTWITPEEATDPAYWVSHLRQTVRLSDCLEELLKKTDAIFLEVGPGRTLSTVVRQHPGKTADHIVLSSTRHPKEDRPDLAFILNALAHLWLAGVDVDWTHFYANEERHRTPLPTYPFERKRYWISPAKMAKASVSAESHLSIELDSRNLIFGDGPDQESAQIQDGAPRNEVERSLRDIWRELLGVNNLSIHDNFFDVGGSSLIATRLLTHIANVFAKKLPLATIFEAPTIEQLASLLRQEASPVTHSSVVKIQSGHSKPPFYCLPGNLGNVFIDLGHLNRFLGLDQPVYGLQDGVGHPSKVEALAAHYVEEIRYVQPKGPYYLGGICSGGVIAFEMAQQFIRQGQQVAFLALIEPASLPLPGTRSYFDLAKEIWERFTHLGQYSGKVAQLSWGEIVMLVRLRIKLISNLVGLKRYFPQVYPREIHLFLTKESLVKSPRLGWREFAAGGVEVHEIPGTHRSITGDYAKIEAAHMQALGEKLRTCIDNAIGDHY